MTFKPYDKRVAEQFDLVELCQEAGFFDWQDEAALQSQPATVRAILDFVEGKHPFLFYRSLHTEGIEIFTFPHPTRWRQESQTSCDGLAYFCFPNKIRVELEKDVSSRPQFILYVERNEVYSGTETHAERKLHLDKTFPDKCSHFALEILLAYAKKE